MSNQIFHFSNSGVSSGQRFYLKDDVAGIFVKNLNINTNFPLVIQDNLLQSSQPSGYLTGIGYSGNYDGGYFLGRTKLSQNTSRLVDSSFGNIWVRKDTNRPWTRISISSDGKYQSAIVFNEKIYVSSDYGNSWVAKESNRSWFGISISSDGKYQSAVVDVGRIYISSDYGNSWVAKESNRDWRGISISSDGKYQTAVVNGGRIYISSDYGNSWTSIQGDLNWTRVSISSDGKYQTAVGSNQIYVSSDYGNSWVGKDSSRNWESVSISSDGKYQSAVANSERIYVSSDYGNSWVAKESNRVWLGISISSDGKYQSAVAFAGQIYVSSDYGNSWVAKESNRNWYDVSISSDGKYISAVCPNVQIHISKTDEQIDGNLYAENLIYNTGNQTISGVKTFASRPTVNGTGVLLSGEAANITLPATIVYTTGAQTISGVKTFFDSGIFSNQQVPAIPLLNNPLSIVGSGNNYLQVNIQNRATGTTATADLVITANNGTDSSNYINLGINNSGYNDPNFSNGSAYDGYLFVNGGSLDLGTQTTGTSIEFHIGGTTLDKTIARITSAGLNIVTGNLSVSGNSVATSANLFATGSVLDNKINSLSGSSVLIFGPQNISGTKTFISSSIFNSNITVGNNLTVSGNSNITGTSTTDGNATFRSNVTVLGDLRVTGNITNQGVVLTRNAQTISGVKTFLDKVLLNTSVGPGYNPSNDDYRLNIAGNVEEDASIQLDSYGGAGASSQIMARKARGTATNLSGILKNDVIFNYAAKGYVSGFSGYSTNSRAQLRFTADEDWVARSGYTGQGTFITIRTTNTGTASTIDKVIIGTSGLNLLDGNFYVSKPDSTYSKITTNSLSSVNRNVTGNLVFSSGYGITLYNNQTNLDYAPINIDKNNNLTIDGNTSFGIYQQPYGYSIGSLTQRLNSKKYFYNQIISGTNFISGLKPGHLLYYTTEANANRNHSLNKARTRTKARPYMIVNEASNYNNSYIVNNNHASPGNTGNFSFLKFNNNSQYSGLAIKQLIFNPTIQNAYRNYDLASGVDITVKPKNIHLETFIDVNIKSGNYWSYSNEGISPYPNNIIVKKPKATNFTQAHVLNFKLNFEKDNRVTRIENYPNRVVTIYNPNNIPIVAITGYDYEFSQKLRLILNTNGSLKEW
jgi:hypothetical protein